MTALFVGTRAGLILLSIFALRFFPLNTYNRDHNAAFAVPLASHGPWRESPVAPGQALPPLSRHSEPAWIAIWARWDVLWYLRVAEVGYGGRFAVDDLPGQHGEPPATCYYPLLPLLMRVLSPLAGTPLRAGLLIANVSLFGALWLLVRLTRRLLDDEAAAVAGALVLFYPPAFFLSVPYAESLGLVVALATASLVVERRFWAAGALGFLAALARPVGVLLAVMIAVEWWRAHRRDPLSTRLSGAMAALLPILGLATFLAYCGLAFGDAWAPFQCQQTGRGPIGWPPGPIRELLSGPLTLMATRRSVVELTAAAVFLFLGVLAFRYLPAGIALYGLGATLVPLATSLFSFSRVSLASFPVFMTAGVLLKGRPAVARGLAAFFALLLAAFALLYFTWSWIG